MKPVNIQEHYRHANIEQIKIGRTYVSVLLNLVSLPFGIFAIFRKNWKFVTLDCRKMHLRALEQLKMSLKINLTMWC